MNEAVYILGSSRTDFKRNLQREGKGLRDLVLESGAAAIRDAQLEPADIQSGVVGNFAGGMFTGQLHLGAFLAEIAPPMRGLPAFHVEAACASGGVAVLTAAKLIMGGVHDVVLVVGVEQQKTMAPAQGAAVLGAAGDFQVESVQFGDFMFPRLFGHLANIYAKKHSLPEKSLALVCAKNRAHARLNPLAQMRDTPLTLKEARTETEKNQKIAPPLMTSDCSQITDGAAALVLCSGRFAARLARTAGVRLQGFGHTTDCLPLAAKDAPEFSVASRAAQQAYDMAGVGPRDLDGAEVHDCFSISEIIAYEVLGFAGRGEGPTLLEMGVTALPVVREELGTEGAPFNLPVNASGGLIGDGHPVGATGVRQVVETHKQLTGAAGKYQIEGAKRMLTFNMGGTFTTTVVMIWGT